MTNASKDRGEKNRLLFLEALDETGVIATACGIAGVTRSAYEKWRQRIPDFAAKADAIRAAALEREGPREFDGSFDSFLLGST